MRRSQWSNETLVAIKSLTNGNYKVVELPARCTNLYPSRRTFKREEQAESYIYNQYPTGLAVQMEDIEAELAERRAIEEFASGEIAIPENELYWHSLYFALETKETDAAKADAWVDEHLKVVRAYLPTSDSDNEYRFLTKETLSDTDQRWLLGEIPEVESYALNCQD